MFCVDEIVIFDDGRCHLYEGTDHQSYSDPIQFLTWILTYLEIPPYLRTRLVPMHPSLESVGMLPSLDMPHHLKEDEWCQYREGITIESQLGNTTVDTGLRSTGVQIPTSIALHTRVTCRLPDAEHKFYGPSATQKADVVDPATPREEAGYYWGYSVRAASTMSAVFTECPFNGGYDLTFGTSERGTPLSDLGKGKTKSQPVPEYDHMLVVFGGVGGLEAAVRADKELKMQDVKPPDLFDFWVNILPGQGSRTIRTEEALWIGLTGLQGIVNSRGRK